MARVGCCGFALGQRQYYATFNLVEVQQTFYQPPRLGTCRQWREAAPAGFEFTLKAWQIITHPATSPTYRRLRLTPELGDPARFGGFRPTAEVERAWQVTREVALVLRASVVVFQGPPSFGETPENVVNLRRFFRSVDRSGLRLVWEPRGVWQRETVAGLCRELDLWHAVDPFVAGPLAGPPYYLRLHGGPGYRHQHADEELAWLARTWDTPETYFLFNNLSMAEDALRLRRLLVGA
ncbi:MAG: DUF72 domain-containing protein [Chloroflexi bacterium]|nr:DUF72 domain-containing protein [Chloroflexota bacterium]